MTQVLALVKSICLLQLQHSYFVVKLQVVFIPVILKARLCQCFSCSKNNLVHKREFLAGGVTVQVTSHFRYSICTFTHLI